MKTKKVKSDLFDHYPEGLLERFKEFHNQNRAVFEEFRDLSYQLKRKGHKKYSARAIIEKIRFDRDLKVFGNVFKINNDFVSIYARLLVCTNPDMEGFFNLRKADGNNIKSSEQLRREASL